MKECVRCSYKTFAHDTRHAQLSHAQPLPMFIGTVQGGLQMHSDAFSC
jgi:hypothetical protein